jgi:hypothetical protein
MSEFKLGDKVHVSNGGCTFSTYEEFFQENGLEFYRRNWAEGKPAPVGDYTVVATGKHSDYYYHSPLCLLRSDDGKIYIVDNGDDDLRLVEREESKVIYASELMEAARKEPEKYEGKRYKVTDTLIDRHSKEYETAIVRSGTLRVKGDNELFAHVNSVTRLEEIPPEPKPVTASEAMAAMDDESKEIEWRHQGTVATFKGTKNWYEKCISPMMLRRGEWYVKAK